jgi:hypothetical protein
MVFHRQFPVCLLDFTLACSRLETQCGVQSFVIHVRPASSHTTHAAGHATGETIEAATAEKHVELQGTNAVSKVSA